MDEYKTAAVADALELLHLNQIALRAGLEEVSTWIRQRGSVNVHDNANAEALESAIERLRK